MSTHTMHAAVDCVIDGRGCVSCGGVWFVCLEDCLCWFGRWGR